MINDMLNWSPIVRHKLNYERHSDYCAHPIVSNLNSRCCKKNSGYSVFDL